MDRVITPTDNDNDSNHHHHTSTTMKMKASIVLGILALALGHASAATKVFDITGATAFRASSNNAIIQILGGPNVTQYAYTGTQGLAGSNRAIFVGTMSAFPGDTIIVRASWSGSTQGIKDVADQNAIQFLTTANPVSPAGINLGQGSNPAPLFENSIPQWSFSDVDQLLSERPNHPFQGGPVGVVPFMFLAGEGSPAALNNMTDQLHAALWSQGQLPVAMFTGNTADTKIVLATGRNNGSGTRATILAETQYGAFTGVTQFGATWAADSDRMTGSLSTITEFGNGGNSSNSGVRDIITRNPAGVTFNGDPVDVVFVSYLTISDALAAKTEGAREMTYNGVAFSAENVKKGSYSLWGYQQFYLDNDATNDEKTFDAAFRAAIPATLNGIDAIPLTQMSVVRTGGDGGPIAPGANYPDVNP